VGILLVVNCCFSGSRVQHDAPGALRGLFFHSRHVARWCVQWLPPLLLHYPCLLLCFFHANHGQFSRCLPVSPLTVTRSLLIRFRFKNPLLWYCRLYRTCPLVDRSVGMLPLTNIDCLLVVVQSFSRHAAAY
jgi:hypothetical protein